MLALAACLALAAPQPAKPEPEAPASLRALVAGSERIAWVRVGEVRAFGLGDSRLARYEWPHGDAPFASATVEASVFGDGAPASLLLFAGDARLPDGGPALREGMRALVFLEREGTLDWRLGRREEAHVADFVAGRKAWTPRPGGLWVVADDGGRLLRPADAPPLALEGARDVDRGAFEAELDLALDLELPRLEVRHVSNSVQPFRVAIAGDGRMSGSRSGQVPPDALRELWATLERERFATLPKLVGATGGPCLSAMDLCVVTRRGRRSVGIVLGAIEGMPEGERRDATERALRIWAAVPIPERPTLR